MDILIIGDWGLGIGDWGKSNEINYILYILKIESFYF